MVAPAYHWVPEHVDSFGPEVADWADSCGMTLDAEQRLVLDSMYAIRAGGALACTEAGCVCARQNIKTHVFRAAALADLYLFDEPGCMWTAHLKTTSLKSFELCKATIDNYDHLRRYVRRISDKDGEESIELLSGASLEFRTRSARGGRGLSGRRLTLDEAMFLTSAQIGALVPVLSAQTVHSDVQLRYGSSAGLPMSAVLRGVRDRGRAGGDPRLTYTEWVAEQRPCVSPDCNHLVGVEGCALDDPELLAQANPALGRRISLDYVLTTERSAMTPAEFARERLGWWEDPPPETLAGVPFEVWRALATLDAPADPVTFGVSRPQDGSWTSIVACGPAVGRPVVEVVSRLADPDAALEQLAAMARKHSAAVLINGNDLATTLVPGLEKAGVRVRSVGAKEYATACGAFLDALVQGRLGQRPHPDLDAAVAAVRTRDLQGMWAWTAKGTGTDISPLAAATLALHGHLTTPTRGPSLW